MLQLLLQVQLGPCAATIAGVHGLRMQSLYQAHVADWTNVYNLSIQALPLMPVRTAA